LWLGAETCVKRLKKNPISGKEKETVEDESDLWEPWGSVHPKDVFISSKKRVTWKKLIHGQIK